MCISQPLGRNGTANRDNATTVQILLNLNLDKLIGTGLLTEDGSAGPTTIGAIEEFQRRVVGLKTPDGRVDPNGSTLRKLREGMAIGFTEWHLRGIMIHATPVNIAKYFRTEAEHGRKRDRPAASTGALSGANRPRAGSSVTARRSRVARPTKAAPILATPSPATASGSKAAD